VKKRVAATFLATAVAVSILTGCSGGGEKKKTVQAAGQETTQGAAQAGSTSSKEFSYPMSAGDKVTYWGLLSTTESPNFANRGDEPFAKAWMEQTGVEIEFMHPPTGQIKEQFSLILADGNLPDMMEYNWLADYPGGPEKAIKEGVILPLNDIFEQYCPNITKYLAENPEIDKMIKTDDGNYYAFPFVRGDLRLCNTIGLMLRGDWLEELGLEVPTTIDEWHTVLTAFKENGVQSPYSPEYTRTDLMNADPFMAAFGICKNFYIDDDEKVQYGGVQEGYRQYLETMAQWYKEGLIDADLATLKFDQVNAKMTNGTAGASLGFAGSYMGTWINAVVADDPDYILVPAPYPTLEKGAVVEYGFKDSQYSGRASTAITTSCKEVERVARLLDYAYGEEGHMLFNFGVEGESYNMINGQPVYSDWVMNNPDGWPVAQAMSAYIRGNNNGPFVQDERYLTQYYAMDCQKDTVDVWGATNAEKHMLPPVTPTSDESREMSSIVNEITTYRDEMALKYIFGAESLDTFEVYVQNIKNMGLDRALEIQQEALERYNNR
jgi:putative aldouronate transport system substrate-binding protein